MVLLAKTTLLEYYSNSNLFYVPQYLQEYICLHTKIILDQTECGTTFSHLSGNIYNYLLI